MGRRWLGFLISDDKKNQKNKRKQKKGWGCASCGDFEQDSLEYSAPQNSVPVVNEIDHEKCEEVFEFVRHTNSNKYSGILTETNSNKYSGILTENVAAIKIQKVFRGFLARRDLRGLRRLSRLKLLTASDSVKRQTAATLQCMQTMTRIQAQVHARRIRMLEENKALQRQFQLKHQKEVEKLQMAEEWDDTLRSKEQIEAQIQNKQEAAVKRERALAYAFTHQWKSSSRSTDTKYIDPTNPQWAWSWMERWMASRPWEHKITTPPSKTAQRIKSSEVSTRGSIDTGSSVKDNKNVPSLNTPHKIRRKNSIKSTSSETKSVTSAKRRLTYDVTAGPTRRQSGPPKVDVATLK